MTIPVSRSEKSLSICGYDGSIAFAAAQSAASNCGSAQLADRGAALLAGICTAVVLGVHARVAVREWAATVDELGFAILIVTSVPALVHVMNPSGQAVTIGHFVAAAGAGLAVLSPAPGWTLP